MSKNVDKVNEVIKAHLDAMAQKDACFAERYANPDKNIDECMDYILGEARRRGMTVYMSDQEVYGMAVHYYEEDDLKVSKISNGERVRAAAPAEPVAPLSEEEKAKIRQEAAEAYRQQCIKAEAAAAKEREKKLLEAKRNAKAREQSGYVASLFG